MPPWTLLLSLWRGAALWLAALVFLLPLRRRPFGWAAGAGMVLCIAARVLLCRVSMDLALPGLWLCCLGGYLLAVAVIRLWADISPAAVFYCGIWTCTLYYVGDSLTMTLRHALTTAGASPWPAALIPLLAAALLYLVSALTLARFMPVDHSYQIGPRELTSAFVLLFLLLFLVQLSRRYWYQEQDWAMWVFPLLVEFYCATLLYLQHELFKKSYIQRDLTMLNQLWAQQKAQYALARRNIALINRKCHELKHQIRAMHAAFGEEKAECLDELEQSVRIYDAIAKTGNEVLDTVLTEKSLLCEANHIQAHCVADGHLLHFMDPVDLYAIFASALDNAIEHVRSIREPDRRMIDVLVYAENRLLVIQISNPVTGLPRFGPDGLPVSTKSRDGTHGYGLRTIRHAVLKYHGFLTVKVEDGCFHLRILLPVKSPADPAQ